jgi:predicted CXXCH cytochrome family protein
MKRQTCFLIASLALLLIPGVSRGAESPCLDCHPDKKEHKVMHPAIDMGCESCHVGTHSGEKPAPKLSAELPDLCFTCHDKGMIAKTVQHAPVAGGMCTSCHNPHGSDHPKLLVAAIPALCFTCHGQDSLVKKNLHTTAAQGKCLTCHTPHASDRAFVLTPLVEEHCLSCHAEEATPKHVMARISPGDSHPLQGKPDPLHKGKTLNCTSCHNPHMLQGKPVPVKSREPGEICIQCHQTIRVAT